MGRRRGERHARQGLCLNGGWYPPVILVCVERKSLVLGRMGLWDGCTLEGQGAMGVNRPPVARCPGGRGASWAGAGAMDWRGGDRMGSQRTEGRARELGTASVTLRPDFCHPGAVLHRWPQVALG